MSKKMGEATRKRVRAGRMLLAGKRCADVAEAVGVARQTVYAWKALLDEGGIEALHAIGGRGRPAQLDERQFAALRRALLSSPTAHGFGTELWALKRVQLLIERKFGVSYSEVHVL
jgi:transposase